jgi:hypothetical protein
MEEYRVANILAAAIAVMIAAGPAAAGGEQPRTKNAVIFANFATRYPKGLYSSVQAIPVGGPDSFVGQAFVAVAFVPAKNATVKEIDFAGFYSDGASSLVSIHLYADAGGVPGQELWARNVALPQASGCCARIAVADKSATQVLAGTQYWIGVTAAGDTLAAWSFNVLDQVDPAIMAMDNGTGWQASASAPSLAFGVYGN